ncbi:hypothetical protein AB0B28_11970 [Glycomyces sp. NPDC046736]|uniref:hypothetical protein n=1 Tax=Glycomyces sp. NPDC046736 TaxID=3155615 RepID=UPI0033FB8E41
MAVKITFRPTPRQVFGRALFLSLLALVVALVPAAAYMLFVGHWYHWTLLGLVLVAAAVAATVAYLGARRRGTVLDEHGIHPLEPPESQGDRYAPWTEVADIRAERRAGRTVPVVYLRDPRHKPWRLQAPYSGRGLSADDALDEKIFVMRSLWEGYRRGPRPGRPQRG